MFRLNVSIWYKCVEIGSKTRSRSVLKKILWFCYRPTCKTVRPVTRIADHLKWFQIPNRVTVVSLVSTSLRPECLFITSEGRERSCESATNTEIPPLLRSSQAANQFYVTCDSSLFKQTTGVIMKMEMPFFTPSLFRPWPHTHVDGWRNYPRHRGPTWINLNAYSKYSEQII